VSQPLKFNHHLRIIETVLKQRNDQAGNIEALKTAKKSDKEKKGLVNDTKTKRKRNEKG
jgi:hypothetical protein